MYSPVSASWVLTQDAAVHLHDCTCTCTHVQVAVTSYKLFGMKFLIFAVYVCVTVSVHFCDSFREIKRLRRQKRKLKERLVMKGDVYREMSELTRQEDLFRLGNIKSRNDLEEVERGEMEALSLADGEDDEEREESESLSGSENEEMEGIVCVMNCHILEDTVNREVFVLKFFGGIKVRVDSDPLLGTLMLTMRMRLNFACLNFVARTDYMYENILTAKISRFTVCELVGEFLLRLAYSKVHSDPSSVNYPHSINELLG